MKKALPYIVLLIVGLSVLLIKNRSNEGEEHVGSVRNGKAVNRVRGFDRRVSYLEYTQHAKCRMECRSVNQEEVKEIMQSGKINYRKSSVKGRPCPTYAVEGYSSDKQHLRIVFAQCDEKTKVVTCIDLGKDWECDCTGDERKYKK